MRLQLMGRYTIEEFHEALKKIVGDLERNDITSLSSVNFYFQMQSDDKTTHLLDDDGHPIDHMMYDLKTQRKAVNLPAEFTIISSRSDEDTV